MNEFISTFKIRSQKTRGHLLRNSIYYMQIFFFFFLSRSFISSKKYIYSLGESFTSFFSLHYFSYCLSKKSHDPLFNHCIFQNRKTQNKEVFDLLHVLLYALSLPNSSSKKENIIYLPTHVLLVGENNAYNRPPPFNIVILNIEYEQNAV